MNNMVIQAIMLRERVKDALLNEKGQGLVEYALIIALVAVFLAASLTSLKTELISVFTDIVAKLSSAT